MELENIPTEVLSLILGQLPYINEYETFDFADLRNARLVCRKWNTLASEHLFRTIPLLHNPHDKAFTSWNAAVDSQTVKQLARVAEIHSGPHHGRYTDMQEDRDLDDWDSWDVDEWKEFQQAISRLADLPNLNEVYVRFSCKCQGDESTAENMNWAWGDGDVEKPSTRLNTLRHVFRAMKAHKARYGTIRTLSIENLANHPVPELVSSDDFHSFVKDITTLRLRVAEEFNEEGPDHDLEFIERRTFEPFLQSQFLPLFADQLTSLHLGFNDFWGTVPGNFDGSGLHFPVLKHLHLYQFAISHNDHFDWVLRQTSLERLHLNRCVIVSYLAIYDEATQKWGVKTHDWRKCPPWAFGFGRQVYGYDGTWEIFFDKIRTSLTHLVDFRMARWLDPPEPFVNPDPRSGLSAGRYVCFDMGTCGPWDEGDPYSKPRGYFSFGDNDPTPTPNPGHGNWRLPLVKLNRAKETEKGDFRAWEKLMQSTRERRSRTIR